MNPRTGTTSTTSTNGAVSTANAVGTASAACRALAERTGTNARDWYPVFKARYGMLVAFETLAEQRGRGAVATQLFTCCTAVDPIVTAELIPVYADVDADTLAIDPNRFDPKAIADLRAVMLQHTFGLVDEPSSAALAERAHAVGALVMEDCAHCVGRMARDERGLPLADISIHSFGVEKMLPTRFGGAVWINPRLAADAPALDRQLRSRLAALPAPGGRLDVVTKLYVNQNRVFSRLGGLGGSLRRTFTRLGWYEPPIADVEQRGGLAYRPFASTAWIDGKAAAALHDLDGNEDSRRAIVGVYRRRLADCAALEIPGVALDGPAQPLLRFPLFAADTATADRLIEASRSVGGYAERWYRPELFPGVTDEHAYGLDRLDRGTVTVSDDLVARALCLPTELSEQRAEAICDALLEVLNRH
ncbi:DegT/DnrJ/EryC1/StrS family aminotransferase [Bifidobacterium simiarum]|uniref:DegT/DnrJ/EryC1/StrS family aminotransferase n=1 Tax=Bifidobacterium simiarum TaxID=2045441 RepID=UPI001BDD4DCD|nr:DegT/DnrJ/EryC1/StrS family aminotransferase [Bifidobacterium simiarum]MBT1165405.1 DegT/DnrJ/EryC1/StrS aminotransferase family protein [Bifidobacterium simiarum]